MGDIFVIGDPHLGHYNIVKYGRKSFSSIEEHDETIITNWNQVVKPKDTIIIDGDFALTSVKRVKVYLSRLNGKKIMVLGDHDKQVWKCREYFEEITKYKTLTFKGHFIVIFHWCIRSWQQSHWGSYHIYAHSHGRLPPIGKSHDCGVDNNNFTPLNLEDFIVMMESRPNNPNFIRDRR